MNKIYKLVWSKVKNMWVVASELAKSHTKSPKSGVLSRILVTGVLMCILCSGLVVSAYADNVAYHGVTTDYGNINTHINNYLISHFNLDSSTNFKNSSNLIEFDVMNSVDRAGNKTITGLRFTNSDNTSYLLAVSDFNDFCSYLSRCNEMVGSNYYAYRNRFDDYVSNFILDSSYMLRNQVFSVETMADLGSNGSSASVSVGLNSSANRGGVSIGFNSKSDASIAIGYNANASDAYIYGTLIGSNSYVSKKASLVGSFSEGSGNSVVFGYNTKSNSFSKVSQDDFRNYIGSHEMPDFGDDDGESYYYINQFGRFNYTNQMVHRNQNDNNVVVGSGSMVRSFYYENPDYVPPSNPLEPPNPFDVPQYIAYANIGNVIVGTDSTISSSNSVALGTYSTIAENSDYSVALGAYSSVPADTSNVVSVGREEIKYGDDVVQTAIHRRIINVSDGVNDSDAATVGQLNDALANVNSSANGTVTDGNTEAVSGGTVFTENRITSDGTFAKVANTTAQNITALDTAIGNAISGLSVDGTTITYTKGDGTTGTITTQDNNTTYDNMSASELSIGTDTTARTVSAKVLADYVNSRVGDSTVSTGSTGSTAVGDSSVVTGNDSVSVGDNSSVTGTGSVSVGTGSSVEGDSNVSIGNNGSVSGSNSVAIGSDTETTESDTVAVGGGSSATGEGAVSLGAGTSAKGDNSTALGNNSFSTSDNSVALGSNAVAGASDVVSVGHKAGDTDAQGNTYVTNEFRRIINVANGVDTNDVATVGQMNTAINTETSARTAADIALGTRIDGTIQGLSVDGRTITYTKGDGTTGTITTQDTIYSAGTGLSLSNGAFSVVTDGQVAQGNTGIVTGNTVYEALEARIGQITVENDATNTVAVGDNSSVSGDGAVAVGSGSSGSGEGSVAVGDTSSSSGGGSVAVGSNTTAESDNTVAIGTGSTVSGTDSDNSVAIGQQTNVTGSDSVAVGGGSSVTGTDSTALGGNTVVNNDNSVALGSGSNASQDNVVSVGHSATDTDATGTAYGSDLTRRIVNVADGSSVSDAATVGQTYVIQNGTNTTVTEAGTNSIGQKIYQMTVNTDGQVASGNSGIVTGGTVYDALESRIGQITVGNDAQNTVALGDNSSVSGDGAVAVGSGSSGSGAGSIAIGDTSASSGESSVAIGSNSKAESDNTVVIGTGSAVTGTDSDNSVAIGKQTSITGSDSVALGADSLVIGNNSFALGGNTVVRNDNSVALGSDSNASNDNVVSVGHKATDLDSEGNAYGSDLTRRIVNVADGVDAHDVVTVGQMNQQIVGLNSSNTELDNRIGAVASDGNYIRSSATTDVAANLLALDTQLKNVSDFVGHVSNLSINSVENTALASGTDAIAIGNGTVASGNQSISIGTGNRVNGANSGAIGDPNIVDGANSYVVGNNSTVHANVKNSFVLGNNTTVSNGLPDNWDTMTDAEKKAWANSLETTDVKEGVIALGNNISVSLNNKVQNSRSNNSTGDPVIEHVVALGDSVVIGEENAIGIGHTATATALNALAIGDDARAVAEGANAIGHSSRASNSFANALGYKAEAIGEGAGAFGQDAQANANFATAFGRSTRALAESATAIGNSAHAVTQSSVAIGTSAVANGGSNTNAVAIGRGATIGSDTQGYGEAVALGGGSNVQNAYGTALGSGTSVSGQKGTAVGYNASVTAANAVALGADSVADTADTVSVGATGATRKIVNVTNGSADTDVSTVGQTGNDLDLSGTTLSLKNANGTVLDSVTLPEAPVYTAGDGLLLTGTEFKAKAGDHVSVTDNGINVLVDGAVAENNTGLVSGGDVYTAVNTEKTARETAITGEATARSDADTALQNNIDTLSNVVVKYDSVDTKDKVTLAGTDGTTIDNVKDAVLSATSKEAVTGSQLFVTNTNVAAEITNRTNADTELGARIGTVSADGNYIKSSSTYDVAQNLGALDTAVKANADAIEANKIEFVGVNEKWEDWATNSTWIKKFYGVTNEAEYNALKSARLNSHGEGASGGQSVAIGRYASATYYQSTAVGDAAKATGSNASAFGENARASGTFSTAIGSGSKSTDSMTVALGSGAEANGERSVALGGNTSVLGSNSVAIGYASKVKDGEDQVVSFGQDAYTIGTVTTPEATRRLIHVTAGINDTDAVNVKQLDDALYDKADWNAANIGRNLVLADDEYPDGMTAEQKTEHLAEVRQNNLQTWGEALGAGTVTGGDSRLVTGDTVHVEVRPAENGTYVKTNNTTGQNLLALDQQLSTVLEGNATQNTAISDLQNEMEAKANVGLDNITDAGKTVVRDLAKESVKVVNGTNTTVTEGIDGNAKTYAVNAVTDGAVADGNTGIVTGGTVYSAIQDMIASSDTIDGKANVALDNVTEAGHTVIKTDAKSAVNVTGNSDVTVTKTDVDGVDTYNVAVVKTGTVTDGNEGVVTGGTVYDALTAETRPVADGNYIVADHTAGANLTALDTQVKANADAIAVNTTDITNLKDLSNITDAGQTVVKNLAKGSVNVVGANKASVTKTNVDGVDTYTVDVKADGVILADNKGLVDGGTVFDAVVAATGNIIDYTNDGLAGKANVELDNINPAGHTVIKTDAKSAINVIGGTNAEVVKTDVDGVDTYTVNVAGNGQVVENNMGLMNGGTVYAELRPTDGNYVRKDATTAANLSALDTKIGTVVNGDFVQSANTVGQNLNALDDALYDKANWDGSNIGRNTVVTDDDYPAGLTDEQKAEYAANIREYNLQSWGQALGAGTVTGGDARLITGDTLHVEVRPANSGTYVKVDKTTGENLLALDEQLSSVVNGASAQNTTINNLENEMANKANIALDNINADGQNVVRNIAKSAVVVADGSNTTVASSTDTDGNITYRVTANATGTVTEGNTGLVDGGTVYTAIENAKNSMGGEVGGLDADGNYIRKANTVAENLVALDTQVKTNADGLVAEQTARETADTALGNRIGTLTADGNYIAKDSSVSENLSSLDTAVKSVRDKVDSNTADITNLKDLSNITAAGETVIKDLAKGSVKVINGTRTTVTEGTDGDTKTFAVNVDADGTVTDGNTGLVTGDTVYDALQNVQGSVTAAMADKANVSLDNLDADGINRVRDISKAAVSVANGTNTTASSETDADGNVIYKVNVVANGSVASGNAGIMSGGMMYDELRPADGNYVARSSTTAANLTALDAAVEEAMTKAETAQAVTGGNVVVYDTDDRSSLTLGGADGTVIHNVADGAVTADSKDAVTGGQLYTVKSAVDANTTAIAGLDTRVQDNTTAIDTLRTTVTNGLDGKTDTDLGNLTDAGKDAVRDLAKESVRVADGVNTTVRTTVDGDASVYHVDVAANGRVESGNTGIVTGDAVYEAIRDIEINASDTHYVSINPSEKDDETFANHGASGKDAVAIGAKSYASGDDSVVIGHNNDVSGNETYVIGSDIDATGNNSVVLGKGSDGSLDNVVSVGSAGNERRIVHVADGELSADSKDAVNGKQLYEVRKKLQNAEGIDVDKWSDALGTGSVAPDDERLVKGSTVYSAIQSTGISLSPDGSTMNVGAANNATVVDFTNSEGNGRVLQGIVTDPGNPNSAANVGYVNAIGQNIVNGVNNGLNRLDTKINKVGAGAAALASLAPMPFDDDQKWSVSAAIGTYHGTQAGAVGVFYKPQDNVMLNIRGAIGNGENMGGAGLSIGLNKGAAKGLSKSSMAKAMNAQANEIVAQKQLIENQQAQLDAQKAEIEELKQMVRSVVASKQVDK